MLHGSLISIINHNVLFLYIYLVVSVTVYMKNKEKINKGIGPLLFINAPPLLERLYFCVFPRVDLHNNLLLNYVSISIGNADKL